MHKWQAARQASGQMEDPCAVRRAAWKKVNPPMLRPLTPQRRSILRGTSILCPPSHLNVTRLAVGILAAAIVEFLALLPAGGRLWPTRLSNPASYKNALSN